MGGQQEEAFLPDDRCRTLLYHVEALHSVWNTMRIQSWVKIRTIQNYVLKYVIIDRFVQILF
jgi:hypothetical protein